MEIDFNAHWSRQTRKSKKVTVSRVRMSYTVTNICFDTSNFNRYKLKIMLLTGLIVLLFTALMWVE